MQELRCADCIGELRTAPNQPGLGGFSHRLLASIRGLGVRSQRLACEIEPVVLLHDPVQDCIGNGGVTDPCVPVFNGQLAGDDGGLACCPVVDDFHEVGPRLAIDARYAPIIN